MASYKEIGPEVILPDTASEWLEKTNGNNVRALNFENVERIRRAILRGEWEDNGDPIRLDPNGLIVDGQHRLTAIAKAGIPVEATVARGFTGDVHRIDTDRKNRTLTDYIKGEGVKYPSQCAAVVRAETMLRSCSLYSWIINAGNARLEQLSTSEMFREWECSKERIQRLVNQTARVAGSGILSHATAAVLLMLFQAAGGERTGTLFFNCLGDDEKCDNLGSRDAVFKLRRRLIDERAKRRSKDKRALSKAELVAITIKAWNHWRSWTSPTGDLRVRLRGSRPEKFPEII